MKKFLINNWTLVLLLLLISLTVFSLFKPGYIFHHDDLHVMRIFEMRKCFEDLQIPCRWVPDMGWGNGYPLFNYYSAFPYYIGAILSYFLGYVYGAKALFFIVITLGGITMYFLGKELFGKLGGLVAGSLYLFAPYRALDAYIRGAIAESFGLALIPLVFYFFFRLIKKYSKLNFLGAVFSLAAFLLSHNLMSMIFLPFFFLWVGFWLYQYKLKNLKVIFSSFILGVGLSAFFLLPAFFEKSLIMSETLVSGGFQYWIHFVTLYQLFLDRSFGHGASMFGPVDTISFQIGWPHWWLIIVFLLLGIIFLFKKGYRSVFNDSQFQLGFITLLIFLISIFMTHNKSTFIWQNIQILQYTQFPWRFLGLTIFSLSILGGLIISLVSKEALGFASKKLQMSLAFLIIVVTVLFNWTYFFPVDTYKDANDKTKLSGNDWEFQRKASLLDYLPKTAPEPTKAAPANPQVNFGNAKVKNFINKSNKWQFDVFVKEIAEIEIPVFEFPNWVVRVNNQKVNHSYSKDGRITLNLTPGNYKVEGNFTNTQIRTIANLITVISFLILIIYSFYDFKKFSQS